MFQVTFHQPIHFGQALQVGVRTTRMGNKSFTMAYRFEDAHTSIELASGLSVQVAYDYRTSQTIALPESWRQAIAAFDAIPIQPTYWLNGVELTALDEDGRAALRADNVGFVFQSFHLIASLTALENVMLPLELSGAPDAAAAALQAIRTVGLEPRRRHYPHQLSGGEKQRVAIARAFVVKPTVLFADEPTGNLDNRTGEAVIDLLFRLNAETGTTLVLVTHDLGLAERCDRVLLMDAGRIERESARDSGRTSTAQ